jgi:soluble lytic murein transglycosylase
VSALALGSPSARAEPLSPPLPYVAGQAAQDFALERWEPARAGMAGQLAAATEPGLQARLRFLLGICDARLGRWAQAAGELDEVAETLPLIVDHVRYEAARAWYFARDMTRARDRAGRVAADSVLAGEAQLIAGDALRGEGKWREAAALYERYLRTGRIRTAEARFHLGEAYEQLRRPLPEVLKVYRQIGIEAPLESWTERARARLDVLGRRLDPGRRRALEALTAPELVTRGKVYFDNMRNERSEADFAAALAGPGLTAELRCVALFHRAESAFKQRQRARSAPLFDLAMQGCSGTSNEDLQVRSAYQGGRAWAAAGEYVKAGERFAAAEQGHGGHSFADDARLRQAEAWASREPEPGAAEQVTALLQSIPERYPGGDMKGEALWRLAWRAYQAGDLAGSIRWLERSIALIPHEDRYYAEGQAWYWIGRARARMGDGAAARAAYLRAAREYPLSHYALLAMSRLREDSPAELARLEGELRAPPAGWRPGTPLFTEPSGPPWDSAGYRRGVELLRLGLGAAAERELTQIGLRVPPGRQRVDDPAERERLWATALLYDRAGRYDKSHWIARWSVLDYKQAWPTEANRAKWEIAYPRAFWHILDPAARAQGFPTELLIALVREESAFNPLAESFANAIGLTMMAGPTATRFGKGLGFPMTRENLRDPEKNVAVGSRWLAFLWQIFEKNPPLIVAAYNAGESAVWKWLCLYPETPLDELVEQIPYDETRNYTKRVLSSYFAYSYLRDGAIPVLSNAIPRSVINDRKCPAAHTAPRDGADKPDKKVK